MPNDLLAHIRAEFGKSAGTLSLLIASKEAATASMPEGPGRDLLNDEIIVLDAMRSRHCGLINQLDADKDAE